MPTSATRTKARKSRAEALLSYKESTDEMFVHHLKETCKIRGLPYSPLVKQHVSLVLQEKEIVYKVGSPEEAMKMCGYLAQIEMAVLDNLGPGCFVGSKLETKEWTNAIKTQCESVVFENPKLSPVFVNGLTKEDGDKLQKNGGFDILNIEQIAHVGKTDRSNWSHQRKWYKTFLIGEIPSHGTIKRLPDKMSEAPTVHVLYGEASLPQPTANMVLVDATGILHQPDKSLVSRVLPSTGLPSVVASAGKVKKSKKSNSTKGNAKNGTSQTAVQCNNTDMTRGRKRDRGDFATREKKGNESSAPPDSKPPASHKRRKDDLSERKPSAVPHAREAREESPASAFAELAKKDKQKIISDACSDMELPCYDSLLYAISHMSNGGSILCTRDEGMYLLKVYVNIIQGRSFVLTKTDEIAEWQKEIPEANVYEMSEENLKKVMDLSSIPPKALVIDNATDDGVYKVASEARKTCKFLGCYARIFVIPKNPEKDRYKLQAYSFKSHIFKFASKAQVTHESKSPSIPSREEEGSIMNASDKEEEDLNSDAPQQEGEESLNLHVPDNEHEKDSTLDVTEDDEVEEGLESISPEQETEGPFDIYAGANIPAATMNAHQNIAAFTGTTAPNSTAYPGMASQDNAAYPGMTVPNYATFTGMAGAGQNNAPVPTSATQSYAAFTPTTAAFDTSIYPMASMNPMDVMNLQRGYKELHEKNLKLEEENKNLEQEKALVQEAADKKEAKIVKLKSTVEDQDSQIVKWEKYSEYVTFRLWLDVALIVVALVFAYVSDKYDCFSWMPGDVVSVLLPVVGLVLFVRKIMSGGDSVITAFFPGSRR